MSRYFEMTDFLVENLLEDAGDYTIESNEKGRFINILINVKKDSMGKIIGKNGRVISFLRSVIKKKKKKDRKIVKIEVKEF